MKLERKAMLDAVDTVRPGLAAKAQIDAFAHVWFDGKTAMAYNDADLGMEVPFVSELSGGLRGPLLLGMLNASKAKDIEITAAGDDELLLKAGGTKLTLPLLAAKEVVWTFPDVAGVKPFTLTKEMLAAVAAVMVSTGDPEPSVPEKLGVTFEPGAEGHVNIYTTDSVTIAMATCPAPKGFKVKRVTMPTSFWSEVLKRCKDGGKVWLMDDQVIAASDTGIRIFSKLVDVPRPQDFPAAFASALPKGWKNKKQAIPPRLPLAFQRASILLEGHESLALKVTQAEDRLRMEAKTDFGELKESIKLEKPADELEVSVDPSLVSKGFAGSDDFLVSTEGFAFFGTHGFIYLVSACI